MKVIGIIPARMDSLRFPGKPMEKIHGMPMIGHCYNRTAMAIGANNTYVATCDMEIVKYINSIGGNSIMTANTHTRATSRSSEALEKIENDIGERVDIVIMVQGDEPLIQPETISKIPAYFYENDINIVNIMSLFKTKESFEDENNVKVVVGCDNNALYFSREPIPSSWKGWEKEMCYMQTGIIAFRRDALAQFNAIEETPLEQVESVDMNRVLEIGGKIKMVLTKALTIGVDTFEELIVAEKMLANDKAMKSYL